MKKWIFIFFLNYSYSVLKSQSAIDVLHYKFRISLTDNNDTIHGYAAIEIKFLEPVSSFTIDLATQDEKGRGMKADMVTTELMQQLKFVEENDKLKIVLLQPAMKNESITFTIFYHGIPKDGLIISKNKFGDRTFFADNWPDRAHYWLPCIDDPADKASFEFLVTAPSQYKVISNGIKTEEKLLDENNKLTHWKEDIPLSTKIMVIGVAKFAIKEFTDSPVNIPISAWVYPKDSMKGFRNYSVAPDIVKFYSSYVASYPFSKLANVESTTIYGGMENASAIFYNEASASSNTSVESLLAHEIAHQWFGDMLSEKKFAHLWLSEGFATYLTHLYMEAKYGNKKLQEEMKDDRVQVIAYSKESEKPVVDSTSPFRKLLNPNSYQKGSWVLHMLRRQIGDTAFHKIIQTFYERYHGKNAATRDFEAVAEDISGKNLKSFFDQWLYSATIPDIYISWYYIKEKQEISITVEQKQNGPAFIFPLEILLKNETGSPQIRRLNITRPKETFSIPATKKPLLLETDPNTSLLFSGVVEESKN